MNANLNINNFLKTVRELILKSCVTFDKSEFCPTSNDIPNMVKEMLSNLMADASKVKFKQTLSGAITEVNPYEKKQSFCSDFSQMIKNIVGLLGFEFSKFLMVHMGMFKIIDMIVEDVEAKSTTYEDVLYRITAIYNLMKSVPKSTYNFMMKKTDGEKRQINQVVLEDDGVTSFFDNLFAELNGYIQSKSISQFDIHKAEIVASVKSFIDSITQVILTAENPTDLVIMNMGEYGLLYDGSFIKIFEILYKSIYADNPRYNDKSVSSIVQFNLVERTMDTTIGLSDKTSTYYVKYLEEYFNNIYRMTYESLYEDAALIPYLQKVQLVMTNTVITAMSKITLCMFTRLVILMNWNRVTLLLTSTPSRIQYYQVLQAFLCLPSGIDFSYTEQQMFVICYVLTSDSSVKATKSQQRKKTRKTVSKKTENEESS